MVAVPVALLCREVTHGSALSGQHRRDRAGLSAAQGPNPSTPNDGIDNAVSVIPRHSLLKGYEDASGPSFRRHVIHQTTRLCFARRSSIRAGLNTSKRLAANAPQANISIRSW